MQDIVFEDPYEFVPAHHGTWWPWWLERIVGWHLRRSYRLESVDVRGVARLRASLDGGDGIILAPNHSRPSDPAILGNIAVASGHHLFAMASWNVFKGSGLQTFLCRRLGAFSIYREGLDRTALNYAIDILARAERPLVVFPEGMISRTNDRLSELQEGLSLMARAAARKRAQEEPAGRVVVHPVAIKYRFDGDLASSVEPVLEAIESRLSWQSQAELPVLGRIDRIGRALLGLKEMEYQGEVSAGSVFDRRDRLVETILGPLEEEWCGGRSDGGIVARVKRLRSEILPGMVEKQVDETERQRRWKQLADCYLAQQLSLYPTDYVQDGQVPERVLETIERFEEDLTDVATPHGPMTVLVEIGESIEVPARRDRSARGDVVMERLQGDLVGMLRRLSEEIAHTRRGKTGQKQDSTA